MCVRGIGGGAAPFRLSRGFPSLSGGYLGIRAPSPPPRSAARGDGTGPPRPYGLIGRVPAPPPPLRPRALASEMAAQVLGKALVSAKWLSEAVKAGRVGAGLRVLDASWYPPQERNARQEFRESHIPGASFFDIEECRDKSSPYDFMLPSEAHFADYVGHLGIGNDTHVVVYDGDKVGTFYAPRAWWMFRVFGHREVSVLNGGFKNWVKEGHPVTAEVSQPTPAVFKAKLDKTLLKTFEEMMENVGSRRFQVVDSRPEGRFRGTELDQGLESGHIPGAVNIPFQSFLTETGHEKSIEEIQQMFREKKVDLSKPLTITCRKGVTACHIALAAYLCGKPDVSIYDGSWSEWFHRAPPEYKVSEMKRNKA